MPAHRLHIRTWTVAALMIYGAALMASPAAAQAVEGRSRFLRWALEDTRALVQQVNATTPLYLMGATSILYQASYLDGGVNDRVQAWNHGAFGSFLRTTNAFGGPRMNAPVVGLFILSLGTRNRRFQDAAFTSLQAMLLAGGISYSLKYAYGRLRPYEDVGAQAFRPFSGNTSFPSGHTTTVFAVLTPWVLYYAHPVTYGLFVVAAGTGMARMARDKHWLTDVLAGGSIGFLTARWLTRRHQGQTLRRVRLEPRIGLQSAALRIRW